MSRIAYFDLIGGAAGDMLLAALLDAAEADGRAAAALARIRSLPVGAGGVGTATVIRCGIRALALVGAPPPVHAPTRTLPELLAIVGACALPPRAAERAGRVFSRLAEAEARVHGRAANDVRLHEAGSDDAVIDVVGVCLALEALDVDQIECSPVPLGGGRTLDPYRHTTARPEPADTCDPSAAAEAAAVTGPPGAGGAPGEHHPHDHAHPQPIAWPAPATAEILRGVPVNGPPPFGEATTPTGAALVVALAERFGPPPDMTLATVGYGAGMRDPADIPNVVRVLIGSARQPARNGEPGGRSSVQAGLSSPGDPDEPAHENLIQLETNLDDLSPQYVADAAEALREAGALDAWITPVLMKKDRPGFVLSALVATGLADAVRRAFFLHTTTLGVREVAVRRTALVRRLDTVEVRGRPVRVKVGLLDGVDVTATPEHDDVVAAARAMGIPPQLVSSEARATWEAAHHPDRSSPGENRQ